MGSHQLREVPSQRVLVVIDGASRQLYVVAVSVDHSQILHIDEVESFADCLVWLTLRFRLLVHPLEVKDSGLNAQLVQHELCSNQPNGCLRLDFDLIGCELHLLLLEFQLVGPRRAEVRK